MERTKEAIFDEEIHEHIGRQMFIMEQLKFARKNVNEIEAYMAASKKSITKTRLAVESRLRSSCSLEFDVQDLEECLRVSQKIMNQLKSELTIECSRPHTQLDFDKVICTTLDMLNQRAWMEEKFRESFSDMLSFLSGFQNDLINAIPEKLLSPEEIQKLYIHPKKELETSDLGSGVDFERNEEASLQKIRERIANCSPRSLKRDADKTYSVIYNASKIYNNESCVENHKRQTHDFSCPKNCVNQDSSLKPIEGSGEHSVCEIGNSFHCKVNGNQGSSNNRKQLKCRHLNCSFPFCNTDVKSFITTNNTFKNSDRNYFRIGESMDHSSTNQNHVETIKQGRDDLESPNKTFREIHKFSHSEKSLKCPEKECSLHRTDFLSGKYNSTQVEEKLPLQQNQNSNMSDEQHVLKADSSINKFSESGHRNMLEKQSGNKFNESISENEFLNITSVSLLSCTEDTSNLHATQEYFTKSDISKWVEDVSFSQKKCKYSPLTRTLNEFTGEETENFPVDGDVFPNKFFNPTKKAQCTTNGDCLVSDGKKWDAIAFENNLRSKSEYRGFLNHMNTSRTSSKGIGISGNDSSGARVSTAYKVNGEHLHSLSRVESSSNHKARISSEKAQCNINSDCWVSDRKKGNTTAFEQYRRRKSSEYPFSPNHINVSLGSSEEIDVSANDSSGARLRSSYRATGEHLHAPSRVESSSNHEAQISSKNARYSTNSEWWVSDRNKSNTTAFKEYRRRKSPESPSCLDPINASLASSEEIDISANDSSGARVRSYKANGEHLHAPSRAEYSSNHEAQMSSKKARYSIDREWWVSDRNKRNNTAFEEYRRSKTPEYPISLKHMNTSLASTEEIDVSAIDSSAARGSSLYKSPGEHLHTPSSDEFSSNKEEISSRMDKNSDFFKSRSHLFNGRSRPLNIHPLRSCTNESDSNLLDAELPYASFKEVVSITSFDNTSELMNSDTSHSELSDKSNNMEISDKSNNGSFSKVSEVVIGSSSKQTGEKPKFSNEFTSDTVDERNESEVSSNPSENKLFKNSESPWHEICYNDECDKDFMHFSENVNSANDGGIIPEISASSQSKNPRSESYPDISRAGSTMSFTSTPRKGSNGHSKKCDSP